jgi:hypothetical protein
VTFPQTILDTRVELQLGGVWTDITDDVYARDDGVITITRGRPDEASNSDPGTCAFDLNNRSGNYSPRNPLGAYYGLIGRNTPVRVSVHAGTPGLAISPTGTPASSYAQGTTGVTQITGDLDARCEAELDWYAPGTQTLIGRWSGSTGHLSYLLEIINGSLYLYWSPTGTDILLVYMPLPAGLPARAALRGTLDVDNGAGGYVVTFYWAASLSGAWTMIGAPFSGSGTTTVSGAPTVAPVVGNAQQPVAEGRIYAAEVRSGIGGTVVASPNFSAASPGDTTLVDSQGTRWTLQGGAEISNRRVRFCGEVPSWPARWDTSGADLYVPVQAAGITRRLGQGVQPLQSTLRRRVPSGAPVAYWPMEDAASATQLASALPEGRPAAVTGMSLAADDSLAGSAPLPTVGTSATLSAPVPGGAGNASGWHVEMVYLLDALPGAASQMVRLTLAGGTAATITVTVGSAGVTVAALDGDGAMLATYTSTDPAALAAFAGAWSRLQIFTYVSGGTTYITAAWINVITSTWYYAYTTLTGTPGAVRAVAASWPTGLSGMALGHLGVFAAGGTGITAPGVTVYDGADDGFLGETASARMTRLAGEEGIPLVAQAPADAGEVPLGPQTLDTALTVLQASADAEGGLLVEQRAALGLAWQDRASLYNQLPGAVLAYGDLVAPLEPEDDDQRTLNDVTVARDGGSSARATLSVGALSTLAPPDGVGSYPASVTLSLADDSLLDQIAGWRLHLGTVDEPRFPAISVYLQRRPALIDMVAALDVGDRWQVTGVPLDRLPPGGIDQLIEGYTEVLAQYRWELTFQCGPASPWSVGVLDDPVYGRVDTDGSSLAAAAGETDTTLSVASSGTTWTVDHSQTPWDVTVSGEQVTVAAVGGPLLNPNSFFTAGLTGWTGTSATIAPSTAQLYPGAVGSALVTPNGTSSSGGVQQSPHTAVGSVTPGASYVAMAWVYSPAGWADLRAVIDWYDSSDTLLSTGLGSATAVPAGSWTFLAQTLVAPALASRGAVRARFGGTPPSSAVYYAWGVRWLPAASVTASSPQTLSVIRSVNSVVKAFPSGADVRLTYPTIAAL